MPTRLERETLRVRDRLENGDPAWPAQLAVGITIALNLTLTSRVTIGPNWLLPAIEFVLLAALVIVSPARLTGGAGKGRRRFALIVIGFVSLANIVQLGLLVHFLINGGKAGGHGLIISGVLMWLSLVLLFAVWYWEFDRGGPAARFQDPNAMPDFYFPQMDADTAHYAPANWRPGFLDYLYTSLTNSTAFSPTDTMPLTHTAKVLMGLQGTTALLTIGLVIARAVNILST
jgi:uncharacterized membrane protein